ncbi:hypothetical protein GCM10007913_19690 [Devosia yakushimensis]|uniref:Uncharacterized protein n=1 Tax=Devosia yakushimensis TaxID=470028 RepID=A0ABQ5UD77_9HYPH|nr:hypothetical protein GCM10007913_19690 [Devosia yakushimensis]
MVRISKSDWGTGLVSCGANGVGGFSVNVPMGVGEGWLGCGTAGDPAASGISLTFAGVLTFGGIIRLV